jgi:hypothetical protein
MDIVSINLSIESELVSSFLNRIINDMRIGDFIYNDMEDDDFDSYDSSDGVKLSYLEFFNARPGESVMDSLRRFSFIWGRDFPMIHHISAASIDECDDECNCEDYPRKFKIENGNIQLMKE